ncbi:MAG: multidrug efflux pump subunit AcrB [Cryomorphaceae bacterium]|jgi:multidrug efflux pump subunit AcrB
MKSLISWWADNHVAANLLMVAILISGVIGYSKLEREIFPTIAVPGMQVIVSWPGASPRDVEEQIVSRIEESLKDLENLDWIRSESGEGWGGVFIVAESSADFSTVMDEVTSRVRGISSLPPDIEQPRISQWIARNEAMRVAVHGHVGERELKRLAEQMRREVAQLNGISVVELFGTRAEEISIEVSESALRRYQITFDEITRAIRASSVNLTAGNVRTEGGEYTLRTNNLADTEVDFANIVVRQLPTGGAIRVGDVATVIDGFEEDEVLATLNGEPAVLVQVMSSEIMDVVTMSDSVKAWIEERKETLPAGVSLTLWQDSAVEFKSRLSTIGSAAFSGLILVFLVLFLTLRPIVAMWVAIGVATAYAGAFVFLGALGVSLNMLSTFAFLLVLGIVVDDAIIVGERIHTEIESGNTGLTGSVDGAFRVSKPVIFGVLTTIIAFLPWIFISGVTSEFTRQISWVVILALGFSLVESLFILPSHLANIKPQQTNNRFTRVQSKIADSIVRFGEINYGGMLERAVKRPGLTVTVFVAILIVVFMGVMGGGYVRSSFMPEVEAEQIHVNIDLRDGTTYTRALEILAQMERAQEALVDEVEANAVDGKSKVVENWYTRSRRDSVIAIVKLAPAEVRALGAKEAAVRLRELIGPVPEAESVTVGYSLDNDGPDMDISVRHPDLDQLQLAVDELTERLRDFSSLYDVSDNLNSAGEELRFELKPGAEQLGLTLGQVMRQVRQAYYGDEVQRLPRASQDVRVMVRYPLASRNSLESLKHFRVRMNDGREVPLTSVVNTSYGPGIKEIRHWDGLRAARVSGYLKEPVREEIMQELEESFFPQWEAKYPGLTRAAVGEQVAEQEFGVEIVGLLSMALVAMMFLLAVAFKSYFQPVVILIAIPFAFVGSIIGHYMFDVSISLYSYFGTIAASGVVINDNLVLVDSFNNYRKQGLNVTNAIVRAGKSRFRAILITSVTTIIGLIPLMLEQSSQAEWLKPIAIALTFGLLIAFFVTLFLVPALLIIGDKIATKVSRSISNVKLKASYAIAKYES